MKYELTEEEIRNIHHAHKGVGGVTTHQVLRALVDKFPYPEQVVTNRPMKLCDDVKVIVKPGDISKVIVTRPIKGLPELVPYETEWDYADFSYLLEPIPVEPVACDLTPDEAKELLAKGKEFQDALKPQLDAAMGMPLNEPEPMFKAGDKVEYYDFHFSDDQYRVHEGVVLCVYQFACDVLICNERYPRFLSHKSLKKCTNTK